MRGPGASSGIGQAIAQALAAAGARVIGYARRFPHRRLTFLPGPGEIRELQLDVTDGAEVTARFAELPVLDVLVNAAGMGYFAWLSEHELAALLIDLLARPGVALEEVTLLPPTGVL